MTRIGWQGGAKAVLLATGLLATGSVIPAEAAETASTAPIPAMPASTAPVVPAPAPVPASPAEAAKPVSPPVSSAPAKAEAEKPASEKPASVKVAGEDLTPHRAVYEIALDRARPNSGVIGVAGTMAYEWADACSGWTVAQRYKLTMQYQSAKPAQVESNFVTWEAKDGKSYRFNERKTRNGQVEMDLRGTAVLDKPNGAGTATFLRPKAEIYALPPGTFFPTAHTAMLVRRAQEKPGFVPAEVFDGSVDDGAVRIGALIGPAYDLKTDPADFDKAPVAGRKSWPVRLAFFPDSSRSDQPDYELQMRLLDNGVSSSMTIDYGDYVVTARLKQIEALPKSACQG